MMVEKESGRLENLEFPSLWIPSTPSQGLKMSVLFEEMILLSADAYFNVSQGTGTP